MSVPLSWNAVCLLWEEVMEETMASALVANFNLSLSLLSGCAAQTENLVGEQGANHFPQVNELDLRQKMIHPK